MPAELKPDATCPQCGAELAGVTWTQRNERGVTKVTAEYFHARHYLTNRRKRPCRATMTSKEARQVRAALHGRPM